MWKYNRQINIRWFSFITGVIILLYLAFFVSSGATQLFSQVALKAELTKIQIAAEFAPIWLWPAGFVVIILLMLAGVPSVIFFTLLSLTSGFLIACILTFFAQFIATFIAMRRSWKAQTIDTVSPQLEELLQETTKEFASFAFWSRVYYSCPLRSIDALTAHVHPQEQPLYQSLIPAGAALIVRMTIPIFWVDSLINLLTNVSPDPSSAETQMLFWSSALIVYTMMPRIPELFICPANTRKVLLALENRPEEEIQTNNEQTTAPAQVNEQKEVAAADKPMSADNRAQPELVK